MRGSEQPGVGETLIEAGQHLGLGWFSNGTGTSVDDGKKHGKDYARLRCPICRSAIGQAICLICARRRQVNRVQMTDCGLLRGFNPSVCVSSTTNGPTFMVPPMLYSYRPAVVGVQLKMADNLAADCCWNGQSAKTADWLVDNDVVWPVLRNCACANPRKFKIDKNIEAWRLNVS